MGTMIEFDDQDLLRNKVIPPAWYRLQIGAVGPWEPTKDQQSNNCEIEATVKFNADTNESDGVAGVPVTIRFNDKKSARGFIEGFLKALGVEVTPGRYDLSKAEGQEVDAFVANGVWEGRTRNEVKHQYRSPRQ